MFTDYSQIGKNLVNNDLQFELNELGSEECRYFNKKNPHES